MHRLHEAQIHSRPITRYVRPISLEDALMVLAEAGPKARAVAGGTDLILEISRGHRPDVDTLVDLSALTELNTITVRDGRVELGATVTHSDVVGCDLMRTVGLPLAQACLEVGAPQLRNHATLVGNVVTASPANDTLSALYALDASVTVASVADGERIIPIADFVTGYRTTALRYGELVTHISFDALHDNRRGVFMKLGLRRVQAISVVHAAVVVNTDSADTNGNGPDGTSHTDGLAGTESAGTGSAGTGSAGTGSAGTESAGTGSAGTGSAGTGSGLLVTDLVVALGSVGPTIQFVGTAAEIARGRRIDDPKLADDVAAAASRSITPMDDLRSTAEYREHAVGVAVRRALLTLAAGTETSAWPCNPPRLVMDNGSACKSRPTTVSTFCGHGDICNGDNSDSGNGDNSDSGNGDNSDSGNGDSGNGDSGNGDNSDSGNGDNSDSGNGNSDNSGNGNSGPRTDNSGNSNTGPTTFTDDSYVTARVNGVKRRAVNAASRTLLEWLRTDLGLTGVKEGCAEGECGACTVHMNGRAVLACLLPAARADGADVVTVEGVAPPGDLHPVQQALADSGGVQCGFCTPGFVMSAAMLTAENPTPDRAQVEHALSGNLCRCTGYYPIIQAITP